MPPISLFLLCALLACSWIAFRIRWWQRVHYHTLVGRSLPLAEVHKALAAALAEFDRVASDQRVTYWLDSGSLLGAYRGARLIAWDDDLDVCIEHRDHQRLLALRDQFRAPYRLIQISQAWSVDKVIPGLARIWPCRTFLRLLDTRTQLYVDIFEAAETAAGKVELLPLSRMHRPRDHRGRPYAIERDCIYPLQTIEFEGRRYPAPHRVEAYLQHYFGEDLSPDRVWDAAAGRFVKTARVAAEESQSASKHCAGSSTMACTLRKQTAL